jgi:hypothetical protein
MSILPNRRRLGSVNVVCVIVLACIGETKEKKRKGRGAWQGTSKWADDSEHEARMEVHDYVQRATIKRKRIVLYKKLQTSHAILDNTCLFRK